MNSFRTKLIHILIFVSILFAGTLCAQQPLQGKLQVTVTDSLTGAKTPVRIKITSQNRPVKILPREAIAVMYGLWDHADGYGFQPDSSFYADGFFEALLPPGQYTLWISKGLE